MHDISYHLSNVICIMILACLFFSSNQGKEKTVRRLLFHYIILFAVIFALSDIVAYSMNGSFVNGSRFILFASNMTYLISMSAIGYLWIVYSLIILTEKELSVTWYAILAIPLIVFSAFCITTPINGLVFTIQADNTYIRGPFVWLHWLLTYPYIILPTVFAIYQFFKRKVAFKDACAIAIFVVCPAICSVVQVFLPGVSIMQMGITVSIVLLYLMLQNEQIFIEGLTRIPNRLSFNNSLQTLFVSGKKDRFVFLIMADINSFKMINDTYGHLEGDHFLFTTAQVLSDACSAFPGRARVFRYGGDEFFILGTDSTPGAAEEMIQIISAKLGEFNSETHLKAPISLCFGYEEGKIGSYSNLDELISKADHAMYLNKDAIKQKNAVQTLPPQVESISYSKIDVKKRIEVSEKEVNRNVILCWFIVSIVISLSYTIATSFGIQSPLRLLAIILFSFLPIVGCAIIYKINPSYPYLKFIISFGALLCYGFLVLTTSHPFIFIFILSFIPMSIIYHNPKLIFADGIVALGINIADLAISYDSSIDKKEYLINCCIILIGIFACFFTAYIASRIHNRISTSNRIYFNEVQERSEEIRRMSIESIITVANVIDAKDPYTKDHSLRVAQYSKKLAEEMNLPPEQISILYSTALLHDIGKMGIPDEILKKPGKLTDDEYRILKEHTTHGAEILKDFESYPELKVGARWHHERFDGRGYPDGIAGSGIPLIARIISVADSFDAMTSDRVYRSRLTKEQVLEQLHMGVGTQWDPEITKIMISLYEQDIVPFK